MSIDKKVKCLHCKTELVSNPNGIIIKCQCGKVYLKGKVIIEGIEGSDYEDITPILLNE